MKPDAMPVLDMRQYPPTGRDRPATVIRAHINLNAVAIATTVTPRLTHGPQIIIPAMIVMAKSGKNNLPRTILLCDRDLRVKLIMLRSFLLTVRCAPCLQQE